MPVDPFRAIAALVRAEASRPNTRVPAPRSPAPPEPAAPAPEPSPAPRRTWRLKVPRILPRILQTPRKR
jgi:hypothetical protein